MPAPALRKKDHILVVANCAVARNDSIRQTVIRHRLMYMYTTKIILTTFIFLYHSNTLVTPIDQPRIPTWITLQIYRFRKSNQIQSNDQVNTVRDVLTHSAPR